MFGRKLFFLSSIGTFHLRLSMSLLAVDLSNFMITFSSGQLSIQSLSWERIPHVVDGVSCSLVFWEWIPTLLFTPFLVPVQHSLWQAHLPRHLSLFGHAQFYSWLILFFVIVLLIYPRMQQPVCKSFFLVHGNILSNLHPSPCCGLISFSSDSSDCLSVCVCLSVHQSVCT